MPARVSLMFAKILIANRGEIACRIIRTARRLGIATVAVYSDADRDALHVEMADEAVAIGPGPAAQSYLLAERIVEACRRTGAEAVHPGYGFLSERAAFAEALEGAGLVFIGPNARAIAAMGDKLESKRFARAAGVSTVPGSLEAIESAAEAARLAAAIGFPVMIKASAGGGGKGMRVARDAAEVAEGYDRARSEAAASFGDDRLLIEKYIVNPRHIEIQVLGDRHGSVVHLGERECSIQRRNQKVIEEAPSPLLDEATRRTMGAQAVALAQAVGYDSAGTVEFVAGQDRSFYFLEMNTRLQVEHPVTEFVTGLDLVEQMIRIAAGEPLGFTQAEVRLDGWAVESRIYAEDPTRGFLPSTGRLVTYRPPAEGTVEGVSTRIDVGVSEGRDIPIFYDPLVAKLVTHAPTRGGAIEAQARALDGFAIRGIRHNIAFLAAVMAHPRWRDASLSTGFIAEQFPEGFAEQAPTGDLARRFAAVAGAIDDKLNGRKRQIGGQMRVERPHSFDRARSVAVGGAAFRFTVETDGAERTVCFDDGVRLAVASPWRPGEPVWRGAVGGVPTAMQVISVLNGVRLTHAGRTAEARVLTLREAELAALMPAQRERDTARHLRSPMPGVLRELFVTLDQMVRVGEALAVVEAMKMENVLRAERDGRVAVIHAKPGDVLALDAAIMDLA